jgi:hypothetical protein
VVIVREDFIGQPLAGAPTQRLYLAGVQHQHRHVAGKAAPSPCVVDFDIGKAHLFDDDLRHPVHPRRRVTA